jgi:hypothetical protein
MSKQIAELVAHPVIGAVSELKKMEKADARAKLDILEKVGKQVTEALARLTSQLRAEVDGAGSSSGGQADSEDPTATE